MLQHSRVIMKSRPPAEKKPPRVTVTRERFGIAMPDTTRIRCWFTRDAAAASAEQTSSSAACGSRAAASSRRFAPHQTRHNDGLRSDFNMTEAMTGDESAAQQFLCRQNFCIEKARLRNSLQRWMGGGRRNSRIMMGCLFRPRPANVAYAPISTSPAQNAARPSPHRRFCAARVAGPTYWTWSECH